MVKNLKVVHLVGGEENSGAFKGANLLHKDLINHNINSKIIYEEDNNKFDLYIKKFRQYYEKSPKIFYPKRESTSFSSAITGINFFNNKDYIESDIVHLHWINNGFFNISSLKHINKPIVWTIRDMWPFTGGCHYTLGCNKYTDLCTSCPQLNSAFKNDLSTFNFNRKIKYIKNKKISFVVNSNWMNDMSKKSKILKNETIYTFFPSFDLKNYFRDYDQSIRERLNIKKNKKIILFGAQNIEAKYKGFEYFLDSINYLEKSKYIIIFFGHFWNEKLIKDKGIEFINLGFVNDVNFQRKLYSISDLFIACSLQEGFPKTVAESLLCKTPVVYFKETAIEDICDHKNIGGYGAEYCNSKDLSEGIKWLSNKSNYTKNLVDSAAKKIIEKFNSKILVNKYVELYNRLLNR